MFILWNRKNQEVSASPQLYSKHKRYPQKVHTEQLLSEFQIQRLSARRTSTQILFLHGLCSGSVYDITLISELRFLVPNVRFWHGEKYLKTKIKWLDYWYMYFRVAGHACLSNNEVAVLYCIINGRWIKIIALWTVLSGRWALFHLQFNMWMVKAMNNKVDAVLWTVILNFRR